MMEILFFVMIAAVIIAIASSLQVYSAIWMAVLPSKRWMRLRVLLPDTVLYIPVAILFSHNWLPPACGIFCSFITVRLPIIYAIYLGSLRAEDTIASGGPAKGELQAMLERAKALESEAKKRYGSVRIQRFVFGLSIILSQLLVAFLCISISRYAPLCTGLCCAVAVSAFALFAYFIRLASK